MVHYSKAAGRLVMAVKMTRGVYMEARNDPDTTGMRSTSHTVTLICIKGAARASQSNMIAS